MSSTLIQSAREGDLYMSKAHPGFKAVARGIASERNPRTGKPYGSKLAGAILASRTRKASKKAKKANPRLKRVRMPKKRKTARK